MRITILPFLALVAALSITLLPGAASADQGEGALRVGADVYVLDLSVFPDFGDANVQAGVLPAQLAIGAGFQLTSDIVLGARATFGYASSFNFGGVGFGSEYGVLSFLPYFEYMFVDGDIRPFVGAHGGVTGYFPEMGDAEAIAIAGGEFGVHLFADPAFSFSPALWVNFLYNGFIERAGFSIGLLVSLEGWLFGEGSRSSSGGGGGGGGQPAADPTDPESYY